MIGQTILHYRIIRQLGRGGMGTVYLAHDEKLETDRALKFLNLDLGPAATRVNLEREARAQARLIHPNIATLFALEESPSGEFLVQEYVDGTRLDTFLEQNRPTIPQRALILSQIASALSFAHRSGITHRDVKPSNILIKQDGTAKVTDFGLAHAIEWSESSSGSSMRGTVPYQPPEAFRGEKSGERCDVWALGVVGYEVLTGIRPFQGESFESLAMQILDGEIPILPPHIEQTIPGLGGWLGKCMERDLDLRYADCATAYEDMIAILQAAGISTDSTPSLHLRPSRVRGLRSTAIAGSIILCIAIAGYFWKSWRWDPALILDTRDWRQVPVSQSVLGVSWSPDGSRCAYVISGEPTIQILSVDEPHPAPVTYRILENGSIRDLAWSPTRPMLAVAGEDSVFLYDLTDQRRSYLWARETGELSWSSDGRHLTFTLFDDRNRRLFVAGPIPSEQTASAMEFEIKEVQVPGIISATERLDIYEPCFVLDDRFLAFCTMRHDINHGLWIIPREGGEPRLAIEHTMNPWAARWSSTTNTLFASQFPSGDMLAVRIGQEGYRDSRVRQISLGSRFDDWDIDASSNRLILESTQAEVQLWQTPLAAEEADWTVLVEGFQDLRALTLSHGERRLVFYEASPDVGLRLHGFDLTNRRLVELHRPDVRYREQSSPAPDPVSDRFLVFRAFDGQSQGLFYADADRRQIEMLIADPPNGRIMDPIWSQDGSSVCFRVFPRDLSAERRIERIVLQRGENGLSIIDHRTELTWPHIGQFVPDCGNGLLLFTSSSDYAETGVFLHDPKTGETRHLLDASQIATDPTGQVLYFIRGRSLYSCPIASSPLEVSTEITRLFDLPEGKRIASSSRAFTVGSEMVYFLLAPEFETRLMWSQAGR